ncbi:Rtt106-domain-containing protein [Viridothelium virens]|uniref:Rtt106-domain-containing protein n=1 Tax=Viridothelium virens TaxID=1048519 RepID=A0A6A6GWL1_VIRVR|nr:Rtt106-domain-containing protein [Viridothelium virens]
MSPALQQAFEDNLDLLNKIQSHLARFPEQHTLFEEIAFYINNHNSISSTDGPNKKRKINGSGTPQNTTMSDLQAAVKKGGNWETPIAYYRVPEVSFSIPQRKKFMLELCSEGSSIAKATGSLQMTEKGQGGIRAVNTSTGKLEFGIGWNDIEQIICLPVPEKQQRTYNFLIIPIGNDGVYSETPSPPDQIIFTLPETAPKTAMFTESHAPSDLAHFPPTEAEQETYVSSAIRYINAGLRTHRKQVITPNEDEFASAVPQPHRKGEKAFHVKAFRGSKDGFLYFLGIGLVFGFKKPILLFQHHHIDSISFTNVLQRTFNIVITVSRSGLGSSVEGSEEKTEEFEFSMIDQAEYAEIDTWVKKHALNDHSMAQQRKAKKIDPTNGKDSGAGETEGGAKSDRKRKEDKYEPGELERAAKQADQELRDGEDEDDEDDEEDEDFSAGSGGESEGEGSTSEDDGEDDSEGEADSEDEDEVDHGEEFQAKKIKAGMGHITVDEIEAEDMGLYDEP